MGGMSEPERTENGEIRDLEELARRLREADGETLVALVKTHADVLDVPRVRQVLLNPFAGREVIEVILEQGRLLTTQEVKASLARHPQTPQTQALRFVPGLFWRDLVALAIDTRVRPVVRRAAERTLVARLPGLSLGEKMAIARRASAGVLAQLRRDPNPRVTAALLENSRVTQGVLMPLVQNDQAEPDVLQAIADDRRWGVRYDIRRGLAQNPRTPVQTALRMLPHLKKRDLRAVARDPKLRQVVRRRAQVLSGET